MNALNRLGAWFMRGRTTVIGLPYLWLLLFFLLHEQPADVRRKTIAEALRVTKPGGKLIFVDYHKPVTASPLFSHRSPKVSR